jgi:acyl carrier protein
MELRATILEQLEELFEEDEIPMPTIADDTVLLETDLDSLGFAVLVTRLEELLGFDPFSMLDEPVYPVTFKDFVDVYADNAPEGTATA